MDSSIIMTKCDQDIKPECLRKFLSPNILFVLGEAPECNAQLQLFRDRRVEMFDNFKRYVTRDGLRGKLDQWRHQLSIYGHISSMSI